MQKTTTTPSTRQATQLSLAQWRQAVMDQQESDQDIVTQGIALMEHCGWNRSYARKICLPLMGCIRKELRDVAFLMKPSVKIPNWLLSVLGQFPTKNTHIEISSAEDAPAVTAPPVTAPAVTAPPVPAPSVTAPSEVNPEDISHTEQEDAEDAEENASAQASDQLAAPLNPEFFLNVKENIVALVDPEDKDLLDLEEGLVEVSIGKRSRQEASGNESSLIMDGLFGLNDVIVKKLSYTNFLGYPTTDPVTLKRQVNIAQHVLKSMNCSARESFALSNKVTQDRYQKHYIGYRSSSDQGLLNFFAGESITAKVESDKTKKLIIIRFLQGSPMFIPYPPEFCSTPISPFAFRDNKLTGVNEDEATRVLCYALTLFLIKALKERKECKEVRIVTRALDGTYFERQPSPQALEFAGTALVKKPFNNSDHSCALSWSPPLYLRDIFKSGFQRPQILPTELFDYLKANVQGTECFDYSLDYLNLNGTYKFGSQAHEGFMKLLGNWPKFAQEFKAYYSALHVPVPAMFANLESLPAENQNGQRFYQAKKICVAISRAVRMSEEQMGQKFQVFSVESVNETDFTLQRHESFVDTQKAAATSGFNGFHYLFILSQDGKLHSFVTKQVMEKPRFNDETCVDPVTNLTVPALNKYKLQEMLASHAVYSMTIPQLGPQPKIIQADTQMTHLFGCHLAAMCLFQGTFGNQYSQDTPFKCALLPDTIKMSEQEMVKLLTDGLYYCFGYTADDKKAIAQISFDGMKVPFGQPGKRGEIQVSQLLQTIDNKPRTIQFTCADGNVNVNTDFPVLVSSSLVKFHWINWFHYCSRGYKGKHVPELERANTTVIGDWKRDKKHDLTIHKDWTWFSTV